MICRMWRGWTRKEDASAYEDYLNNELFPRVRSELSRFGYRGYHVLRAERGDETEFVTMLWFDSLGGVKAFAGENYETPMISERARTLLSRYSDRCDHYEMAGAEWR